MRKHQTYGRFSVVIIASLLFAQSAFAIDEWYKALPLLGSLGQIKVDSVITVQDDVFFNPALKPNQTTYNVKNYVSLKINEASGVLLPDNFSITIHFKLIATRVDWYGNQYIDSTSFPDGYPYVLIDYNKAGTYNGRTTWSFDNVYRAELRITSIDTMAGVPFSAYASALMIENEIIVSREYDFKCSDNVITTVNTDTSFIASLGELRASWTKDKMADEYDLEWAYIDSSALDNYKIGGSQLDTPRIFAGNATRVSITGEEYKIPLVYDSKGTLFYRVRPVQLKYSGQRVEAQWSSAYGGGLGRYEYAGHETALNWQATTSFAEEGKRKTVVQYYDGSLRSRQTVTKDNSTNTTVVSETFYDLQGRPAIQVLPAPTLNTAISYSRNFNNGLNGVSYDKASYDSLADPETYCNASASAMDTASGAAKYYSAANPQKDSGFHRFIPNAAGYPFAETEYMPDNSGRIRQQGGVGAAFRLNSGHQATYYYGSPDQKELDAMFGTEVGDYSHYFKTMVKDANGQFSVSYADMHGRTVATALAGTPPENILDTLSSKNTRSITESLSTPSNTIVKDLVMESKKGLLVAKPAIHTFTYALNPQLLQNADCNAANVCYNCLYDLEIVITDDCNNQKMGGQAFDTILHNFSLGSIDTSCTGNTGFSFSFSRFLEEGSYEVTKRLSVSRYGMDYYRDSFYIPANTCRDLNSFIEEQRTLLAAILQCKPTCQQCTDSLGTLAAFRTRFKLKAGIDDSDTAYNSLIAQGYAKAQADCSLLCDQVSEYDNVRQAMLLDMTPPSGQYANVDSLKDIYSIFYAQDKSQGNDTIADFRKPAIYLDEAGLRDSVYDERAGGMVVPQKLSRDAFAQKFKLSWAESLLPYHPEYCKLLQYEALKTSVEWDKRFEATDTYLGAMQKGYLNPTNTNTSPFSTYNATVSADIDPITSFLGHDYITGLKDSLTHFRHITSPSADVSLWAFATATVKCSGKANACFASYQGNDSAFNAQMCTADLDMAWRAFRALYLNVKKQLINAQLKLSPCNTTPSGTVLTAAHHNPYFADAPELFAANGSPLPTSTSQATSQATAGINGSYDSNCRAYVQMWWEQLAPCSYTSADTAVIMRRLIAVCKEGSDLNHPFGASSVKPTSANYYRSFDEVIKGYNDSLLTAPVPRTIPTAQCNAFLLSAPAAYENAIAYSNTPVWIKPDSCMCATINYLHGKYVSSAISSDTSFAAYLFRTAGTVMSNAALDSLRGLCNNTLTCNYLVKPISVPPVLQCGTGNVCATCDLIGSSYVKFKTRFPGITPSYDNTDSAQQGINLLFERFMNNKLGFTKLSSDYLRFMDTCDSTGSDSCAQNLSFIKTYGDGSGVSSFGDLVQTEDGGYISVGSTTAFGAGGNDALITKMSRTGTVEWSKTFGKEDDDYLFHIRATTDGGYVAIGAIGTDGLQFGEIWVLKIDQYGNKQWSKRINAGTNFGEVGTYIIQTSDGGYALNGYHSFQPAVVDWLLIKLDASGNVTWNKRFGTDDSDQPGAIIEEGDSLVLTALHYANGLSPTIPFSYYNGILMKVSKSDGSLGMLKSYDIDNRSNWFIDLFKTNTGYSIFTYIDNAFGGDIVGNMLKVTSDGTPVNSTTVDRSPGAGNNGSVAMKPTADGGFIVTQSLAANGDVIIQKTDSSGNMQWANQVKLSGHQSPIQIIQTIDSSFAIVGLSDSNALFIKTNALGLTGCSDSSIVISNTYPADTVYALTFAYNDTATLEVNDVDSIGITRTLTQTTVCMNDTCAQIAGPVLCGRSEPVFATISLNDIDNCTDSSFFAISKGTELYNTYTDSLKNRFDSIYHAKCLQALHYESFTVTRPVSEYHYTLYYYDQAGNLVKTVPPAGVDMSVYGRSTYFDSVTAARTAKQLVTPLHGLGTNYRYNTLNQVIAQKTPDAGLSYFWYDRLGRLSISQNARQKAASASEEGRHYSYTTYDYLGRINEVGQVSNTSANGAMVDSVSRNTSLFDSWLLALTNRKEQVTRTFYDQEYPYANTIPLNARNLRNRVAYTTLTNDYSTTDYNTASFYSYDIHGNVDTLLQDYGSSTQLSTANIMNRNGNRWVRMVYKYDLISGKVNLMAYNPRYYDITVQDWVVPNNMFYHRYNYDAENRLTAVETSSDSIIWEQDARYEYYKHGPLARMLIGDQQVQGLDYAYTLQGWLKGVNSTSASTTADMGSDGKTGSQNINIGRDLVGYNLNYYSGDYSAIYGSAPFPDPSPQLTTNGGYRPLYNGNISSMAVNIKPFKEPFLYNYTYDQLNRLKGMDAFNGLDTVNNNWTGLVYTRAYNERVSYDGNGNIQTYNRYFNDTSYIMDELSYHYKPGTNKLSHVTDASLGFINGNKKIKNQAAGNYEYDEIGNLIKDSTEFIPEGGIKWNVYGKITEITHSNQHELTNTEKINYFYDAAGNRIGKRVVNFSSPRVYYTWYVRDAQGNTLHTYTASGDTSDADVTDADKLARLSSFDLIWSESNLYGSNRLGLLHQNAPAEVNWGGALHYGSRGAKFYEISNHLGNVLAVISDKKMGHTSNGTTLDYYEPDVVSVTDYYPFGMVSRSEYLGNLSLGYRYGFNGKENDGDVKGDGNQQDYGLRIYDPRIAKFLSVDPLTKEYPELTPYQFAGNNPIQFIDLDGAEPMLPQMLGQAAASFMASLKSDGDKFKSNLREGSAAANNNYGKYDVSGQSGTLQDQTEANKMAVANKTGEIRQQAAQTMNASVRFASTPFIMAGGPLGYIPSALDAANGDYTGAAIDLLTMGAGRLFKAFPKVSFPKISVSEGFSLRGGSSAAEGGAFYRAMGNAEFAALERSGGLSHMAGKELFVSSSANYSRAYLQKSGYNVLVQFNMKPGAMNYFNKAGVMHRTAAGASGWAGRGSLLWKSEQGVMNLGIQSNTHMFNPWINSFKAIK